MLYNQVIVGPRVSKLLRSLCIFRKTYSGPCGSLSIVILDTYREPQGQSCNRSVDLRPGRLQVWRYVSVVEKLWWEGLGFGPRDPEQWSQDHGLAAMDADPLWTYVHSSSSSRAFNLSTGGHYGCVAIWAPGLLTAVRMGYSTSLSM
jgi:hypothetical protein